MNFINFIDNIFKRLDKLLDEYYRNNNDEIVKFEVQFKNKHKTKIVNINGDDKEIDEKIADLVTLLNQLGVKTTCSCQGDDKNVAYISFSLEGLEYSYNEKYNELTFRWIIV